jgi:hypothetical protein
MSLHVFNEGLRMKAVVVRSLGLASEGQGTTDPDVHGGQGGKLLESGSSFCTIQRILLEDYGACAQA